jgi:hypothetical protein
LEEVRCVPARHLIGVPCGRFFSIWWLCRGGCGAGASGRFCGRIGYAPAAATGIEADAVVRFGSLSLQTGKICIVPHPSTPQFLAIHACRSMIPAPGPTGTKAMLWQSW